MKKWILLTAVALLTLLLTACGGDDPAESSTVTGNVTYLVRMALPPDAVLRVNIQNASVADAAMVIGEQVIPNAGQVPIAFAVPYNPADVQENNMYLLYARIEDSAGNLLFINTQGQPVLTNGAPSENIEVIVEPVGVGAAETSLSAIPDATAARVTGIVSYPEPLALPAGATARIMVQNASIADAPPEVSMLGEQIIPGLTQFPFVFDVPYDPTAVQENALYLLYARVEDANGTLLYLNTQGVPVITQGNPTTDVPVTVEAISTTTPSIPSTDGSATTDGSAADGSAADGSAADGSAADGSAADTTTSGEPTGGDQTGMATAVPAVPPSTNTGNLPTTPAEGLLFKVVSYGPTGYERLPVPGSEITAQFSGGQISGSTGCNTYNANIIPIADYFVFGPIGTTKMYCESPAGVMEQESVYLSSLQGVAGYQYQYASDGTGAIVGLQLFYPLASGGVGTITYVAGP
jgi:putative lipoprotein